MNNLQEQQTPKFSVLLSVYYKEVPEFFDTCLESVYNQTVKASEWVIVKDGPITEELESVIQKYKSYDGVCIKEVPLAENQGLGIALSHGVVACSNELIARMDTDDIAVPDRFELQLKEFELNPDLDLCGGHIIEFETDPNDPVAERKVPLTQEEITEYQKKRSAFNHMTVMFKKSKVLESGNYKHAPLMEDDMLWVDMLMHGAKCKNIDSYLCIVRTNRNMIARRGGLKYFKKYKNARKLIYKTGFISRSQYSKTNFIQFFVCIMPSWLRKFVFFRLIHKKPKNKDVKDE
ncbi:glycosyltransferase [Pumilibacter muris]|uniref:glycosyltransferase n=1 Tax=Pumilibacter muris TaxID=2941510 RepID=UPI00203EAA3B|nr:glycosyltransferase [Pumilibacter muris]